MTRSKLSAICAVLLALSPQAQCADAEPAKGPLTAAEKAQCRAQLTEFNENVRVYNAKVDEIKALEAEIRALRAELDKEEAAVDRRDSAAMQALNARIRKNNELVERHEQMDSALTAMADEQEQRTAQFREACDNRPPATPPRPLAAPTPTPTPTPASQPQPSDAACSSATGAKDVQRQIEATFAEMRADEKRRQAEVDRVAETRAKAQSWSKEKQGQVWMQVLASPKFMAFEREKQPYVQELMRVLGSKPKSGQEECQLVKRIAATLPAIKAINARQYAFMADEIRAAK
jgi:DNA repair exonuclease SbcCD ATPase subunit